MEDGYKPEKLDLVEYAKALFAAVNLEKVLLIGAQHLLGTTHSMINALHDLGLKKENIALIGKCYSTSKTVYSMLKKEGVDVSPLSLKYDPCRPFDDQYSGYIASFLKSQLKKRSFDKYEKVILLDDGGVLLEAANDLDFRDTRVFAVEQTTSGYEKAGNIQLNFPVVNVARSPAKLIYESPMIAQAIVDKVFKKLKSIDREPSNILVIGGGYIGNGLKNLLSTQTPVTIFDREPEKSELSRDEFLATLREYDMIIGCTGHTSIPSSLHQCLHPYCTLLT